MRAKMVPHDIVDFIGTALKERERLSAGSDRPELRQQKRA
jgi:hypothetical protein